jgi:hypothetical protein
MLTFLKRFLIAFIFISFLIIDTDEEFKDSTYPYITGMEWVVVTLKVALIGAAVHAVYVGSNNLNPLGR